MKISIIAALDENYLIGSNNSLPWNMPSDLKRFSDLTLGKTVIMGRKTYESIGKPLPNRKNIVISRTKTILKENENCKIYDSLERALEEINDDSEIMVIGGENIYKRLLPKANKLYLTFIHHSFDGDKHFPQFDINEWKIISEIDYKKNEQNKYDSTFKVFVRKK